MHVVYAGIFFFELTLSTKKRNKHHQLTPCQMAQINSPLPPPQKKMPKLTHLTSMANKLTSTNFYTKLTHYFWLQMMHGKFSYILIINPVDACIKLFCFAIIWASKAKVIWTTDVLWNVATTSGKLNLSSLLS